MVAHSSSAITTAPNLETQRLRLRAHCGSDFPDCLALWSDPRVTRFIGGTPSTAQRAWARLLSYIGHWAVMGFGYWALECRATGQFVGDIGWANWRRDDVPQLRAGPELGFALAPPFHGRGYATEAVGAVVRWGETHLPFERGFALVDARNDASLRVLAKSGFEVLEPCDYNGQPCVILQRSFAAAARC